MTLTGYDIDGVLTSGIVPTENNAVVISGRTFAEYDDTARAIAQHFPTYIRGCGAYGDRNHAGQFKAAMIALLGVTVFHEDDPLQVQIIRQYCPNTVVVTH